MVLTYSNSVVYNILNPRYGFSPASNLMRFVVVVDYLKKKKIITNKLLLII